MALFIEILEGEEKGQRFHISAGVRIGRTTGEILIKDIKASALHAQIEKDEKGHLILVDRDSSNGLWVNGSRVHKVAMLPGVKFQAAKTLFRVVQLFGEEAPDDLAQVKGWRGILINGISKILAQNRTQAAAVRPFDLAVRLEFLEGIQATTTVVLGYGPRKAGADVLDIELQDPAAPGIAFELIPDGAGARFVTKFPKIVLLNGLSISSEMLATGDRIRVGASLIEVQFLS